jgi:hypothetical protein
MERLAKIGLTSRIPISPGATANGNSNNTCMSSPKQTSNITSAPISGPILPTSCRTICRRRRERTHHPVYTCRYLSSNYGLYGPVYEYGINTPHPGKEEYTDNEKYEIKHWDWDRYSRTREIITRVNRIRRAYSALQTNLEYRFQ